MRLWQWFVFLLLAPGYACSAERYAAMFSDGSRVEEAEVREWNEPNSPAKIGGRLLFDPTTPVRWIMDRQSSGNITPAMFVDFEGGDRLAGEVVAYFDGRENPYEIQPAHFIVQPVLDVQPPDVTRPAELRVTSEWVRRIVWERVATEEYRPGTVWLRTGASIAFRSLRWTRQGVTMLSNEGLKEYSFAELGEIHLPRINAWAAYYEQVATLSPQLKSRLILLSTVDGSRWTTSTERIQYRHHGDKNRPEQSLQLIQPAWSLDSIWLRYRTIHRWQFFLPHEIPLSNFAPLESTHQAVFGSGWDYQRDQNVLRGPLQSADNDFAWGFGVHGSSELIFEYPESARAIRAQFGLDRAAEKGGCVDVEVKAGDGASLLKMANVIGSSFVGDLGWQNLPSGNPEQRRISFRTGMAHQGRPANADPFDVRDIVNWYEPELRLDPAALESEVASRRTRRLNGLSGWNLSSYDAASINVNNIVDILDARDPQFRLTARTTDRFYTISRSVRIADTDEWLAIAASRFAENTSPTAIQVKIDGRVMGEFDVPLRQAIADPEPMLVPVQAFHGKTVSLDIVVYPTDEKSWVDWRGFAVSRQRPGISVLYEDDNTFAKAMNQGEGRTVVETEKPFSGNQSLKVLPPSVNNPSITAMNELICEHPRIGQYRFLVFAWKKSSGSRVQLQFANQGRFVDGTLVNNGDLQLSSLGHSIRRTQTIDERGQRYGYCYEQGTASPAGPLPLWLNGDLPKEWQLVRRDLFADFGLFPVTGVALKSVDGEGAWFDHIYLARTYSDLEYAATHLVNPRPAPPQPDANGNLGIYRKEDFAAELSRLAPLFSSLDMPHGLIRHAEQNGQTNVIRTHANAADKPLVLRAGVVLPNDRNMMLDMHVSHAPNCDWQLVVRANGQVIHDQLIDAKLTTPQRGWASIQVDLSKFAGQKVLLEVLNQSNNWQNESAYWKRLQLVEQ